MKNALVIAALLLYGLRSPAQTSPKQSSFPLKAEVISVGVFPTGGGLVLPSSNGSSALMIPLRARLADLKIGAVVYTVLCRSKEVVLAKSFPAKLEKNKVDILVEDKHGKPKLLKLKIVQSRTAPEQK